MLHAEHRPVIARNRRRYWLPGVMLCVVAALLFLRFTENSAHAQQITQLAAESEALHAALERSRLQRQEAQATEEQLLRRITQLSTQIERLQTELAFFRQQKKSR
ncbi:hypothetical protein N8H22_14450 [Stutzerimonas stutzeri]|uniref:hypothetical protein n=1 Tax=Stutzerimonas sp. S1 TaxID=3030652 RepID=UPI002223FAC6|nr:hypothetical protein [Stutzerimonas sp. S1]MCW3149804.1 hypothetical protein [Stutzerimonas sp. S1]